MGRACRCRKFVTRRGIQANSEAALNYSASAPSSVFKIASHIASACASSTKILLFTRDLEHLHQLVALILNKVLSLTLNNHFNMTDAWGAQDSNGADAFNGGFSASNEDFDALDAFAGGDTAQEEPGRIQEDKINKKKLAE